MEKIEKIVKTVKCFFPHQSEISLHEPCLLDEDIQAVADCVRSGFVSSVGEHVGKFEEKLCEFTGAKNCVVVSSGTVAIQVALEVLGVQPGDYVITQNLTFIATANAIANVGAIPIFVDVQRNDGCLCPISLANWIEANTFRDCEGFTRHRRTTKKISAIVPVHILGNSIDLEKLSSISEQNNIPLIEDAAEALGSKFNGEFIGSGSNAACISFNGNKIITTGGGGAIFFNSYEYARRAKKLTTTAKIPHEYEFFHDARAYNYRLPNLNACLGLSQLNKLPEILELKTALAIEYQKLFQDISLQYVHGEHYSRSNHWLNAVIMNSFEDRNKLLKKCISNNIFARPFWGLLSEQRIYKEHLQSDNLENSKYLYERVVCLPSSVHIDR